MSKDSRKGVFGRARLPLSSAYLWPETRRGMLLAGLAAAVVLTAVYVAAMQFGRESWVSGGPLSSAHAGLECEACHSGLKGVSQEKCLSCHEPTGLDIDAHGFARHALYLSNDASRLETTGSQPRCIDCHREHEGRHVSPTQVNDGTCADCHFGSLGKHPEFAALASNAPDDSMLVFTHIRHTSEVLKQLGSVNVEAACLSCHQPEGAGAGFAPVSFDAHCASCHLVGAEGKTVPVGSASADPPGAETLDRIRARREPGTLWAFTANESDYRLGRGGDRIKKTRLEHPDPWVLENLKQIRRAARGRPDLADLIPTAGLASNESSFDLYREMLSILRTHTEALRGRPEREVQDEVRSLDSLSAAIEVLLNTSTVAPAWPTTPEPSLSPARAELVSDLTRECQLCHRMEGASIGRVQKRQTSLIRARFDHAAHVLETGCLDCHGGIPITRAMAGNDPVPASADRSAILNLPGIDSCRDCHTPQKNADACLTCHVYHPDAGLPQFRRSLK